MNSEWAEPPQPQGNLGLAGAQLKAQREKLGWSVDQLADKLKLAPRQVVGLEEGDAAALPNMAVVRGFIRAYAKVVKLDAAPLVAMIEVNPPSATAQPARREISARFSEARFPSLTQRSSRSKGWIVAAGMVVAAAALGAYKLGFISPSLLLRVDKAGNTSLTPAALLAPGSAPQDTALAKPGQEVVPLQSPLTPTAPSVPLISVPPSAASARAAAAPDVVAPAATVPSASNVLVLVAHEDSWVELRRVGATPLIARIVKAGSTETFKVTEPMLLIVGKPAGVEVSLRGAPLELPPAADGKSTRVNIK